MTTVTLGSVLRIELNGQEMTVKIRRYTNDHDETQDSKVTLVSSDAPLAKELLNAQEGEEKEFRVGDRVNQVRVLEILS